MSANKKFQIRDQGEASYLCRYLTRDRICRHLQLAVREEASQNGSAKAFSEFSLISEGVPSRRQGGGIVVKIDRAALAAWIDATLDRDGVAKASSALRQYRIRQKGGQRKVPRLSAEAFGKIEALATRQKCSASRVVTAAIAAYEMSMGASPYQRQLVALVEQMGLTEPELLQLAVSELHNRICRSPS